MLSIAQYSANMAAKQTLSKMTFEL